MLSDTQSIPPALQESPSSKRHLESSPIHSSYIQSSHIKSDHSVCRLFYFNPEHDYALASFSPYYTPPARIVQLKKDLWSLPAAFAVGSDALLYPHDIDLSAPEWHDTVTGLRERNITLLPTDPQAVEEFISRVTSSGRQLSVQPWGWNPAVKHLLLSLGMPESVMPSDTELKHIRNLSSRKFAVDFNLRLQSLLSDSLGYNAAPEAQIFTDTDAAIDFWHSHPDCWMKAPWSSSGRGVIFCGDLELIHIRPWVHGIIRRQGCVTAETNACRVLDFAAEWHCGVSEDGKPYAEFLGWSVFSTSSRGKYHANVDGSQNELLDKILHTVSKSDLEAVLEAQRTAINELIAPYYHGPLGIDMTADVSGHLRACIEINLRLTMGMVAL